MNYDSDNSHYGCNDCHERLTLHADGAITCSCSMIEALDMRPPKHWDITKEQLSDWRRRDLDYQETE